MSAKKELDIAFKQYVFYSIMQVGKLQSGQPGTAFIMLGRGLIRVAHGAGKKEPKGSSREHYQRHQLRRTQSRLLTPSKDRDKQ